MENTNPEASTLASGLQRLGMRRRIMGVTPTAAAIVVRKTRAQPALARFERSFFKRAARASLFVEVINLE